MTKLSDVDAAGFQCASQCVSSTESHFDQPHCLITSNNS